MPFSWASCNAVTWGGEACSQRPCVSSETSETDTLQRSLFFFLLQLFFLQQQLLPHTRNVMNSHLSPGYSPSGVKVWHHSHLRWLCVTGLLFRQIFPVHFLIPHMTTIFTQWSRVVWNFPCQRMENLFADLSSGFFGSGSVQLNADLNHACSLELTHTAAPMNSSVSQEPVLKPKPFACYLRSLVLKLWNSHSPVSPLNHVWLITAGQNTKRQDVDV